MKTLTRAGFEAMKTKLEEHSLLAAAYRTRLYEAIQVTVIEEEEAVDKLRGHKQYRQRQSPYSVEEIEAFVEDIELRLCDQGVVTCGRVVARSAKQMEESRQAGATSYGQKPNQCDSCRELQTRKEIEEERKQ